MLPTPSSLEEYVAILCSPQSRDQLIYNGGTLEADLVKINNIRRDITEYVSSAVAFADPQFMESISDTKMIFIDATFKTMPRDIGSYQLLTLMALKYNHVRK